MSGSREIEKERLREEIEKETEKCIDRGGGRYMQISILRGLLRVEWFFRKQRESCYCFLRSPLTLSECIK